jgi:hypothetical protein
MVVEEDLNEPAGLRIRQVALGELIEGGDEGLGVCNPADDEQVGLPLEVA